MKIHPIVAVLANLVVLGLGYVLVGKRLVFGWLLFASTIAIYIWMYQTPMTPTPWLWGPTQFTSVLGILAFLLMQAAFAYDVYTLARSE